MIETLNTDCFCISLDRAALRRTLQADPAAGGLERLIAERCPNHFAALPVFVSREHVDAMQPARCSFSLRASTKGRPPICARPAAASPPS